MADENTETLEALEAGEYSTVRAAVAAAVDSMQGISKYYAKKKFCEINNLSDDAKGVGLFDLQGAKYVKKHIDGSFVAQYPFSILLRKTCTSDKEIMDMTEYLDELGARLEEKKVSLDGGRRVNSISQTIATFINKRSESNVLTLQANFLLRYRKDD